MIDVAQLHYAIILESLPCRRLPSFRWWWRRKPPLDFFAEFLASSGRQAVVVLEQQALIAEPQLMEWRTWDETSSRREP